MLASRSKVQYQLPLEDQADEAAFDEAISGETIPWDEVKKELGLS